ncbi:MAG: hypothetical protein HYX56_05070 [Chloroflexi bacterium]|nr:hypothetical protein [Chloroflexota bacterium]
MRRVNVLGSGSGVGKTTFGRRLAEKMGVPFIELDALFSTRRTLAHDPADHWTDP